MNSEYNATPDVTELPHRWLRPEQAAEYLSLHKDTLAKMRVDGDGPEFSQLTKRAITYDVRLLDAWLEARSKKSTSEILDLTEEAA